MNIGALIPIRLKSERLPNKALLDIAGKPACYHLLDRVCDCKFIKTKRHVVVCTTTDNSDDALVEAIETYGCSVFRGDENDIIKRFRDAMESFQFDYVVQADGDDPVSATEYMDITMEELLANSERDIVTVEGLPLGCATKSFSRKAIDKSLKITGRAVIKTTLIIIVTLIPLLFSEFSSIGQLGMLTIISAIINYVLSFFFVWCF